MTAKRFTSCPQPDVPDDAVATKRSVYDDPTLAQYYWPKPEYEGLHRFDPEARWTYREEKVNQY